MEEIWADIPGYVGLYQASNKGRIKSLAKNGRKEHILKQYVNRHNGYCYVNLSKNAVGKNVRVHKYIALCFLGERPEGKNQINHIDGDKTNNCVENLEYCDSRENMIHAYKNNLQIPKGIEVICLDTMKIYISATAAARDISNGKANGEMVARVCRGEKSHYRNFHFAFYEDYKSGKVPKFKGKFKKKASVSLWL